MAATKNRIALAIFALLVVLAPLLFGAVDRISQAVLALILALGLLVLPPAVPVLNKWLKWTIVALVALLLFKEFAPAGLFETKQWRLVLSRDFDVAFPGTNNPEPTRALETLLVAIVAVCWFLWVRTLAMRHRAAMAWILLTSAVAVAAVSFFGPEDASAGIYGMRSTPGWTGFGPFPNKNHTASFLAMGALVGCGCFTRALVRKENAFAVLAAAGSLVVLAALFASRSRGGLVVFVVGALIFAGSALARVRNLKALLISIFSIVIIASLCLAFGAKLLARFVPAGEGDISDDLRWKIWSDTLAMWRDAPLLGHGLSSFAQIFPMYENVAVENQYLVHPESSWLQWLVELGAIPWLVLLAILVFFLAKSARGLFISRRSLFVRIGALSALIALLLHSVWDVPAHRWPTAGVGLALLALLHPFSQRQQLILCDRRAALTPIFVAFFLAMPLLFNGPIWSPGYLPKLADRAQRLAADSEEIEEALRFFPLNATLHQLAGLRQLAAGRPSPKVWRHFRIASRLKPNSWSVAAAQALASWPYSPGMALHFWTLAIERTTHRHAEIFRIALEETGDLPMARNYWARFAENNPDLLLVFAQHLPPDQGQRYFNLWWKKRALSKNLRPHEINAFYQSLIHLGTLDQLHAWIKTHPHFQSRDYRHWAFALQHWQDHTAAWKLLARWEKEPDFPGARISERPELLEVRWLTNPQNFLTAQALAEWWFRNGEIEKSRKIILAAAAEKNAPEWFRRKAAYAKAADGQFGEAVSMLLY
jgi:O-antigen ligase